MSKRFLLLSLLLSLTITSIHAQIKMRENEVVEKPIFKPKQFDSLSNLVRQRHPEEYKKYIGYKLFFLPESEKYKPEYSSQKQKKWITYLYSNEVVEITKAGKIPFEQLEKIKIINRSKLGDQGRLDLAKKKREYQKIDKEKTSIYKAYFYHEGTNKTDGEIFGKIATPLDSVVGKYFTILDIKGRVPYGTKEYHKLENIDEADVRPNQLDLKITLRNESNQDLLYWTVRAGDIGEPFFLVPYFEKLRSTYLNQELVLKDRNSISRDLQNLVDVNTGEKVTIKYGEAWTCSDVSFIESKDSYYMSCFYFLKSGDKEVKVKVGSGLINRYFMLESDFRQRELEKQKKAEQKEKEARILAVRQKKAKEKFRQDCIEKWGAETGGYIADSKVVLGMDKEMCIAAWGRPLNINKTLVERLSSEQWVYGWATYLYFENGVLTAIQN